MTSYRVVRRKYADLTGEGARLYGGRFNPPGIPAVYSSESISLALLEILVHLDKSEVPADYVVMAIRFAGRIVTRRRRSDLVDVGQFTPTRFRASFYHHAILRVPSVIVPREKNYVLFPEADGFDATIDWMEPLDFDRRLVSFAG
jgi:RES domain-containing protein